VNNLDATDLDLTGTNATSSAGIDGNDRSRRNKVSAVDQFLTFPAFYEYIKASNEDLLAELDRRQAGTQHSEAAKTTTSKHVLRLLFINIIAVQSYLLTTFKLQLAKPTPTATTTTTSRQARANFECLDKLMLETRVDRLMWDNYVCTCDWKLTGL
jgi:hypothetical protein